MRIHYAIGDVHGRDDLLARLLEQIEATHRERHGEASGVIVYVGDYIDRGGRSMEVIDRVMRGVTGFETIALKGNHEQMMLACLDTDDDDVWMIWLANGGMEAMESFGLDHYERDPIALAKALGSTRIAWLEKLKLFHHEPPYLFVHAGIVPGRPLEKQKEKDLLWIRDHFLDSKADHGFIVVHGHTPAEGPELRPNRINVDTGVVWYGELTAVMLGEADPRFISVQGEPGRGP